MNESGDYLHRPDGRVIETAGPELARIVMGWDGPMWRYRNPWGAWQQGEPPADGIGHNHVRMDEGPEPTGARHDEMYPDCPVTAAHPGRNKQDDDVST